MDYGYKNASKNNGVSIQRPLGLDNSLNLEMDTHLKDLWVRSEAVEQEADDSHVPAVKHQLLRSELQGGVWCDKLGPVRAHCNTGGERGAD